MQQWEYEKINLSGLPPKVSDLDVLNDAGRDGWELVAITANNIAYLKRNQTPEPAAAKATRRR